jgi:uncharacterized protein YjbJ (UPF0337 family)
MSEITLEKVDLLRERTGASYAEAKEALEMCDGNVVDALVYIESKKAATANSMYTSKDEFVNWVKELIRKGNVTRIKIKKDEKVLADIPVNAGLAVSGLAALVMSPLLAIGVLTVTAVVTKLTIEITKDDGSVEVVNKIIKNTVDEVKENFGELSGKVKEKFGDLSGDVKEKINDFTGEVKDKFNGKDNEATSENNVYKYTVKFDEVKNDEVNNESDSEKSE